jgi:hypothetical protein
MNTRFMNFCYNEVHCIYFSLNEVHFYYNRQLIFLDILTHVHLLPSQSVHMPHCSDVGSAVLLCYCVICAQDGSKTSESGCKIC